MYCSYVLQLESFDGTLKLICRLQIDFSTEICILLWIYFEIITFSIAYHLFPGG